MLETALQSWRAIVGVDRVLSDSRDLRPYECATFPWASRCLAVVRPEHARQVQACHRSANEVGVPLLPVSRGRGWGLSGWLQDRDAVVLDLSDLDRILDLDLKTGTARVEPGVTFAALQEALATAGLSYHLPSFGGPLDASVLANALERIVWPFLIVSPIEMGNSWT
ncbi:MAG: FAD-binding protein [Pseudomonadota bacterium]